MATKNEILDLALPGLILDLGREVSEAHYAGRRSIGSVGGVGVASSVPSDLEKRVFAMAKADPTARVLIGLPGAGGHSSLAKQDGAGVRLRAFSLLAYRMLCDAQCGTDMAETAAVAADPSMPPGQAVLAARDIVGRMVADRRLEVIPDGHTPWNPRLMISFRGLTWLAGGRSSLAVLGQQRLAAARLQSDQTGDQSGEQAGHQGEEPRVPAPLPASQIRARMAKRIVGLEGGQLDVVSARLALHMVRSKMLSGGQDPGTPNEVVLMLGESGTGKTWLCETAGRVTGLPYGVANASEMSASGYVGLSAEDGLRSLYVAAKGRPEVCRHGIMCYDEITKRARSINDSVVNSIAVQNEMLRLVSGQMTQVGGKRSSYESPFWLNTYGVFFFLCGHAPGLERLIERRMGRRAIGFGEDGRQATRAVLLDALEDYGIVPELLTRLTAIVVVPPPSLKDLVEAAVKKGGVIESYSHLLGDALLLFEDDAVTAMATHCLATRVYYRGLAAITSAVAADVVAREVKMATVVSVADVRRAVARMDEGVADLLVGRRADHTPGKKSSTHGDVGIDFDSADGGSRTMAE